MQSKEENGLILVRLFPGDDIFQSLETVCRKHKVITAVIISALGQLRDFTLGYFNGKSYHYDEYTKTHELLSIDGVVSWSEEEKAFKFHMHTALANEEKQAVGGHLFKGIIEGTGEIVLQKTGIRVVRKKDPGTGLQGLYIEE